MCLCTCGNIFVSKVPQETKEFLNYPHEGRYFIFAHLMEEGDFA